MTNNPNNYPDPNSPEGKSRAGRLYFSLIVVLFIFLGTVILIHQFGNNIVDKVQLVRFLPLPKNMAPANTEASSGENAQAQPTSAESPAAAEGEQPAAEQATEAPAEGAATEEAAPADAQPAPEEGAH